MRYHAQALPSGEWITHDLPLSDVEISYDLSGPSALTASIARGFDTRKATITNWVENRRNLCVNPSFEVDAENWHTFGGATIEQSAEQARTGSHSLKVVNTTTSGGAGAYHAFTVGGVGLLPNTAYTASMWVFVPTGQTMTGATIFVGGTGKASGSAQFGGPVVPGQWSHVWTQFVTGDDGAGVVNPDIVLGNTRAVGDFLYIDSVLTVRGDQPGDYFDGDTPDTIDRRYTWAGTPGASQSVELVPVTEEVDSASIPSQLLAPWGVAIYPEEDGELRGGFLLSNIEFMPDSLGLDCVGFAGYPQGMIWDSNYQSPDSGVDPFTIVKLIWDHLQDQPDGDLGITTVMHPPRTDIVLASKVEFVKFESQGGTVEFTAQDRYQLHWWDSVDCGQELDKLASETPFDYIESHEWDGEDVKHTITFGYPRIGRRRNDLRFVLGENLAAAPQPEDGNGYASEVIALGAGEGSKMLRVKAGKRTGRLRRTVLLPEKNVTSKRRLLSDADDLLARTANGFELNEIYVWDHPNAPIGSLAPGDEILVQADLGWTDLNAWYRVVTITLHPDSNDSGMQLTLRGV